MSELAEQSNPANPANSTSPTNSTSRIIHTAADIARLQAEGQVLTAQELEELNSRIKALKEMARLGDRLRALENRKRTSEAIEDRPDQPDQPDQPSPVIPLNQPYLSDSSSRHQPNLIRQSIELGDHSDSSDTVVYRRRKRARYKRGIKVTPSYTLKISSSLRE
jgi:hypothetical protein